MSGTYQMIDELHGKREFLDTFLYKDMRVVGGYMHGKIIPNVLNRDGHRFAMPVIRYSRNTGIKAWAFGDVEEPNFELDNYIVIDGKLVSESCSYEIDYSELGEGSKVYLVNRYVDTHQCPSCRKRALSLDEARYTHVVRLVHKENDPLSVYDYVSVKFCYVRQP